MLSAYKLTDTTTGEDIYVNPNSIVWYTYHSDGVDINLSTGNYFTVDISDFNNMMFLEGNKEY